MPYVPSKTIIDAEVVLRTRSYNPKVSMDRAARYTTAASSYDRLLDNGPLTDHKINAYQKEGRLPGSPTEAKARGEKRRPKRSRELLRALLEIE